MYSHLGFVFSHSSLSLPFLLFSSSLLPLPPIPYMKRYALPIRSSRSYVEVVRKTNRTIGFEFPFNRAKHDKQNVDYAYTLLACSDKAKYTLILEDDVAATRHWVNKIMKHIFRT